MTPPVLRDDKLSLLVVLLAALAGGVLVMVGTVNGPGLLPDSVAYIRSARGLLDGTSPSALTRHFPPGLPLMMAMATSLIGEEWMAYRVLAATALMVAVAGYGMSFRYLLGGRGLAGNELGVLALALLALLLNPAQSLLTWLLLSEMLLLACLSWAVYCTMVISADAENRWHWAILALSMMAMCLVRYAALPFVGGALLTIFLARFWLNWPALLKLTMLGLLSLTPLLIWVSLSSSPETGSIREFRFHPPTDHHLRQIMAALAIWYGKIPGWSALLVYLTLISGAVLELSKRNDPALLTALTLSVMYCIFLALTISLFDAHTPLDTRILSPLFPLMLLMALALVTRWLEPRYSAVILLVIITAGLPHFSSTLSDNIRSGTGLANHEMRNAELFRITAALPPEQPIYTNAPEVYYLYYHREVYPLPKFYDPGTLEPNPTLDQEWDELIADLRARGGIIVWTHYMQFRDYLPNTEDMLSFGVFRQAAEVSGGAVLILDTELQNDANIPTPESDSAAP